MPMRSPCPIRNSAAAGAVLTAAAVLAYSLLEPRGPLQIAALGLSLAGLLVLLSIALKRQREQAAQLDEIHATLAKLHGQAPDESQSVTGILEKNAREAQERIAHLQAESSGLKAILAAMEEGILVIDSQKRVIVANPAARKMLNISGDPEPVGRPLAEVAALPDLVGNISQAVDAAQACGFEMQLPLDGQTGRRFILARCAPVHDEARLSGAVAVFHDMSELRRLERMRTEFVANVSHELRTPLTSLLGYLETLESGAWEDREQAQQFLKICHRQAENLSRIVGDLLRLSRLENPQQEIASTQLDLCEAVNTAVEQCQALAGTRRVALEADLPQQTVPIRGERGLLVQAISNLIENAINYNRENGKVQVRLARLNRESDSDSQWEVSVADTGIGIPPNALPHVFERFYRVDKARSRDRGGTGLGLAIVKHIALAHGASIHVESEMNKGSTFFMRFKSPLPQQEPVEH